MSFANEETNTGTPFNIAQFDYKYGVCALYNYIFSESMNAYDNINKTYPTFSKDICEQNFVRNTIENFDELNNKEKVAHAYTIMVLTQLMNNY
jgi:hypothetical protein